MSTLTKEQLERFASVFSGLNTSPENKTEYQRKAIESRKRIVYNDNNEISDSFNVLASEFAKKIMKSVDAEDYKYEVQKTKLTEGEFSRLTSFVRFYGELVQDQSEHFDISVPVKVKGIVLEFCFDYQPTMPVYVLVTEEPELIAKAVTFEEMLAELPKQFPSRDEWTNKELFR